MVAKDNPNLSITARQGIARQCPERVVNEKRIRRLMRLIGLMPIYQKPNTSEAAKGHKTYPFCCVV